MPLRHEAFVLRAAAGRTCARRSIRERSSGSRSRFDLRVRNRLRRRSSGRVSSPSTNHELAAVLAGRTTSAEIAADAAATIAAGPYVTAS
jgi:hypothetical protein